MSDKDIDIAGAIRNLGGDILDLPFWEACRDGRFLLHRCNVCGRHYWPASRCVVHRSEEHTSELQSLMRISYAVFCLKKKNNNNLKYLYKYSQSVTYHHNDKKYQHYTTYAN